MRIIAGQFRGRPLVAPQGRQTRPTGDRTRETLFSMLASRIGGFGELWVADLCAGSGALGLEALSRGAAKVVFVENDRAALDAIKANVAALKVAHLADVRPISAERLPPPGARAFDLVLADPPYAEGSGTALIKAVSDSGWLAPGGWLAVETHARDRVDPGPFRLEAERKVGKALLTLVSNQA